MNAKKLHEIVKGTELYWPPGLEFCKGEEDAGACSWSIDIEGVTPLDDDEEESWKGEPQPIELEENQSWASLIPDQHAEMLFESAFLRELGCGGIQSQSMAEPNKFCFRRFGHLENPDGEVVSRYFDSRVGALADAIRKTKLIPSPRAGQAG